ncbi:MULTISPECIES: ATP-binding protein [unclassified Novosphingobium]|uniref:ATP-binding protein n=1 Tax=unclassified Novosphingobium TaxID=2644732 RepID=UPI0017D51923|nr:MULTISPECIES: ATP-binding protein [unclassified Novosphingobium]NMN06409.1 signal transduction histidine kinase [Novosphingobium sp. SG919]NMN88707.1 signal transduction histidine kinase [Novosphingobium sp. SG916]
MKLPLIAPAVRPRAGLPLGMQLMALLVCALVAAQAVTLGLTVLFPPSPQSRWSIDEVAQGLSGAALSTRLERAQLAGPPDIGGAGWLVAPAARDALAARLHRRGEDVVLAFYTQLPVGGIAVPAARPAALARQDNGPLGWMVGTARAQGMPGGGGPPGGGFPGGPQGGMPGGGFPGGGMPKGPAAGMPGGRAPTASVPAPSSGARTPAAPPAGPAPATAVNGAPIALPTGMPAPLLIPAPVPQVPPGIGGAPVRPRAPAVRPAEPASANTVASVPEPAPGPATSTGPGAIAPPVDQPKPAARPATAATAARPQPIPFRQPGQGGWLALTTPPFIEGDFVAGVRGADGRWTVVAPRAEPFPNRWQRQVALWFLLSLAIVSPLAWLFAQRIVRPLEGFAHAAETLGRDPAATILPLSGPAEIGRAAHAFNQMRNRLRAFVDDRTAMVGAISHDLRTPLTRLRFRLENVPDDQREGLLKEVMEMEAMISQVIAFIRDASTPGPRRVVDLGQLVAASVEDARLVGGAVSAEPAAPLAVEVDPVQIRRLLDNLLENAIKYGQSAKVRVRAEEDEVVAEIVDAGPGIPEEDREHVFEPFYRSEAARRSGKPGSGLGLAVCRSIARAHGGEIRFAQSAEGFVTQVRVPRLFGESARLAA